MKSCNICGKNFKLTSVKYKLSDNNVVCWECAGGNRSYLIMKKLTIDDIKEEIYQRESHNNKIEQMKKEVLAFNPSRNVDSIIEIDEKSRTFRRLINIDIDEVYIKLKSDKIHDLSMIRSYELLDNGAIISSGGFGSAALGAMAFGGSGAITGAVLGKKTMSVSKLEIKLFLNDIDNPVIYITLSKKAVPQNSTKYQQLLKSAHKIISTFDILLSDTNKEISEPKDIETLRNFKTLLDEGIISQEEFESKKKQILNL